MPWWTPRAGLVAAVVVLTAACSSAPARGAGRASTPVANLVASPSPTSAPSASPSPSPLASPSPTSSATAAHVFLIVMENRSYSQAIQGGYTARLAATYGAATDYHGVTHPSLPNYLAMTSGSTHGITDDGYHRLPAGGLGAQLTAAGISWRAYMEGMSAGCFNSPYPYALKHNPFAYYGGACPPQVVSFSRFANDMAAGPARFVWISPGLCHDGHDCSTGVADAWLGQTVPAILATGAWKQGGVLYITWDEGEDAANSVLTIVIRPGMTVHRSARAYNHYNLLATIEAELGLPRLGEAARAATMSDLVG
jgi:phosphatidylinositol-3-phosphatase